MPVTRTSIFGVYLKSVFLGAYVGAILMIVAPPWHGPLDVSELWSLPLGIFILGLFAVPFVAAGLAIFGLPVTMILRHRTQERWGAVVAVVWGCIAGKMMFYLVDRLLLFGNYEFLKFDVFDVGIIYGLPTGIAWWALCRRNFAGS